MADTRTTEARQQTIGRNPAEKSPPVQAAEPREQISDDRLADGKSGAAVFVSASDPKGADKTPPSHQPPFAAQPDRPGRGHNRAPLNSPFTNGYLSRDKMVEIIAGGQSVSFNGEVYTSALDLPPQDEIDKHHARNQAASEDALDAQISRLQQQKSAMQRQNQISEKDKSDKNK